MVLAEKKFQSDLEEQVVITIKNPIQVFLDNYKLRKFRLQFKNSRDEQIRSYLILQSLEQIKQEECEKEVQAVLDIIEEKNLNQAYGRFLRQTQILNKVVRPL